MHRRRGGFTLIELLVVIAIIGILAAMLFPVFARARESARKIQCLSNVKNIAMAFQMYLADYDRFPPTEKRPEVLAYVNTFICTSSQASMWATSGNPWLRTAVILDEYVKNRDVWKCANANFVHTMVINPGINGDWVAYLKAHASACPLPKVCQPVYPPGWGGVVTDMAAQGWTGGCPSSSTAGVFCQDYATPMTNWDLGTSQINDPAKRVVVGDGGKHPDVGVQTTSQYAYPDMCRINGIGCSTWCGGDWINCSWTRDCSPQRRSEGGITAPATSPEYRKEHYHSRHLGGSNLGFADGHAKWMPSEAILFAGDDWTGYTPTSNDLEGLHICFRTQVTQ